MKLHLHEPLGAPAVSAHLPRTHAKEGRVFTGKVKKDVKTSLSTYRRGGGKPLPCACRRMQKGANLVVLLMEVGSLTRSLVVSALSLACSVSLSPVVSFTRSPCSDSLHLRLNAATQLVVGAREG